MKSKLKLLYQIPDNWNNGSGKKPCKNTIKLLESQEFLNSFTQPKIYPYPDGEIHLAWYDQNNLNIFLEVNAETTKLALYHINTKNEEEVVEHNFNCHIPDDWRKIKDILEFIL